MNGELDELEQKAVALLRGLLSGTAAVRVKQTRLPDTGAVVWDITLVQLPAE